jgi:hypothetical protein
MTEIPCRRMVSDLGAPYGSCAREVLRLAADLNADGSPTNTSGAARLWELLSSNRSPFSPSQAAEVYRMAGYVPFEGFPLRRAR